MQFRRISSALRRLGVCALGPALFLDTTAITLTFCLAGAGWLAEGQLTRKFSRAWKMAWVPVSVGLFVWLAVSALWSDVWLSSGASFRALKKYVELLLLPAAATMVRGPREQSLAMNSLLFSASGYSLVLMVGLAQPEMWPALTGYLDAYRVVSGLLLAVAAGWSLAGWLGLLSGNKKVFVITGVICLAGLTAQGGHTGLLAFGGLLVWLVGKVGVKSRRGAAICALLAVLCGLVVALPVSRTRTTALWHGAVSAWNQVPSPDNYTSAGSRVLVLRNTLDLLADAPLTGFGMGRFEAMHNARLAEQGLPLVPWGVYHPHNEYLMLLFQGGPLALLLFAALLVLLWRTGRNLPPASRLMLQSACLAFALSNLANCNLLDWEEGAFFLFTIGLGFADLHPDEGAQE